jgi:hypothetical protein
MKLRKFCRLVFCVGNLISVCSRFCQVSVFRFKQDDESSSLATTILEAALKSESVGIAKKLLHAIQINRLDLARDELRLAYAPDSGDKPVSTIHKRIQLLNQRETHYCSLYRAAMLIVI